MKLSCAVLDDYQGVAREVADWGPVLDRVDVDVFRGHIDDQDRLADTLASYDIVVLMRERTPVGRALLKRLPKLRLLVTTGMRNASVDVASAVECGVTVAGTRGLVTPTVELTWALIHSLARNVSQENAGLRGGGPWQQTLGTDLAGARLGVLGLGNIGARVASVAKAFEMDVVAWSQNLTPERAAEVGVGLAGSMGELLRTSDFVTIHLVLSERTRGLLGAAELELLRPSAYLVNTSRAAIVDRQALLDTLRAGRIAGAGLDVFDVEPLPADDPFRGLPNVLATPHLGYVTRGGYQLFYRDVVEDIDAFLRGNPVRTLA